MNNVESSQSHFLQERFLLRFRSLQLSDQIFVQGADLADDNGTNSTPEEIEQVQPLPWGPWGTAN